FGGLMLVAAFVGQIEGITGTASYTVVGDREGVGEPSLKDRHQVPSVSTPTTVEPTTLLICSPTGGSSSSPSTSITREAANQSWEWEAVAVRVPVAPEATPVS